MGSPDPEIVAIVSKVLTELGSELSPVADEKMCGKIAFLVDHWTDLATLQMRRGRISAARDSAYKITDLQILRKELCKKFLDPSSIADIEKSIGG